MAGTPYGIKWQIQFCWINFHIIKKNFWHKTQDINGFLIIYILYKQYIKTQKIYRRMKIKRKGLGIALIFIGAVITLSNLTITGAVVGSESMPGWRVLGAGFVVGGIVLIFLAGKESRLIIKTRQFEKTIKKHNLDEIQNAIRKIGTGKGHEHALAGKLKGYQSVHTSKGGRIEYHHDSEGNVILDKYDPGHKYRL